MIRGPERVDDYAEDLAEYAVEYLRGRETPATAAETIEDIADHAQRYPEAFVEELVRALRRRLPELYREAGLCPHCGGELRERRYREAHPYGATVAYEEWSLLECPVHGAVEGDL